VFYKVLDKLSWAKITPIFHSFTTFVGLSANYTAGKKAVSIGGGSAADTITGSPLADTITGVAGSDYIETGAGNDGVTAANAAALLGSTIDGGAGKDTLTITSATGVADSHFQYVSNTETLVIGNTAAPVTLGTNFESAGFTSITGGTTVDTLDMSSFSGNVTINGNGGNDIITLGSGNDTVMLSSATAATLTLNSWGEGTDKFTFISGSTLPASSILKVTLSDSAEKSLNLSSVLGTAGATASVTGGTAADTIIAGAGIDTITGGTGIDSMTGGAAADKFVFTVTDADLTDATPTDVITDFVSGTDNLVLGAAGSGTNFVANTSSVTESALLYFLLWLTVIRSHWQVLQ
jgi:Ca2+-binding RTX toxin-like protein